LAMFAQKTLRIKTNFNNSSNIKRQQHNNLFQHPVCAQIFEQILLEIRKFINWYIPRWSNDIFIISTVFEYLLNAWMRSVNRFPELSRMWIPKGRMEHDRVYELICWIFREFEVKCQLKTCLQRN
jgi:hypothetical protein